MCADLWWAVAAGAIGMLAIQTIFCALIVHVGNVIASRGFDRYEGAE